jgi:hypothetical protein
MSRQLFPGFASIEMAIMFRKMDRQNMPWGIVTILKKTSAKKMYVNRDFPEKSAETNTYAHH